MRYPLVMKISDIPADYTLIQNGSDVAETLAYLGTDAEFEGYSYVFVKVENGDYVGAYGSYTLNLEDRAYLIL